MPNAGKYAGSGRNYNDGGSVAWGTPGNITANDNSDATTILTGSLSSQALVGYNFGFTSADIPVGSSIDGIIVAFEWWKSSGTISSSATLRLVSNASGTPTGLGSAKDIGVPTGARSARNAGSPSDLWGTTTELTQALLTSSDFGVVLKQGTTGAGDSGTVAVDYIAVTVYYTPPGGNPNRTIVLQAVQRAATW